MNKKFLSAVLFGALMVSSTGTFVSCKDYDDDINALNEKVNGLAQSLKELQDAAGKYVTAVNYDSTTGKLTVTGGNGATFQLALPVELPAYALEVKDGNIVLKDGEKVVSSAKLPEMAAGFNPQLLKWNNGFLYYGDTKIEGVKQPEAQKGVTMTAVKDAKTGEVLGYTFTMGNEKATFSIVADLKALVFEPELYYEGIEAMSVKAIQYKALTLKAVHADANNEKDAPVAGAAVEVTPDLSATYHMNPATADTRNLTKEKLSFLAYDKQYSRANGVVVPTITKMEVKNGKLTVFAHLTEGTIKEIAKDGKVTVMALQAALEGKEVITSDYAAVKKAVMKDFVLDNAKVADCNHLYTTAAEAINNKAAVVVAYDATVDLAEYVQTHFVNELDKHVAWDVNAKSGEVEKSGFSYKYELVGYKEGSNKTSQSAHAALKGSVLRPQLPKAAADDANKGVAAEWGETEQSQATVGRMPLVRVTLVDNNSKKNVAVGYIKVEITGASAEDKIVAQTEYTFNDSFTLGCETAAWTKNVTWFNIEEQILAQLNISKQDFEKSFAIDAVAVNEFKQFNKVDVKATEVAPRATTVEQTSADVDGTMTEVLKWTIPANYAYEYFSKNEALKVIVRFVKENKNLKGEVISKDYVFVTLNWTPNPRNVNPVGKLENSDKTLKYWFTDNSNDAGTGFAEIHVNTEVPGGQNSVDRFNKQVLETFNGHDVTISGIDAVYKDFENKDLTKTFRFMVDPSRKEMTGVSGTTYVFSVSKDGKSLIATEKKGTASAVIATITDAKDNQGEDLIALANNDITKDLLNVAGRDNLANNLTARVYVATENGCQKALNKVENNEFNVKFLRPITVKAAKMDNFIDGVDVNAKGSVIDLKFDFTDWRGYNFMPIEAINYFEYYKVSAIKVLTDKAQTTVNGKWEAMPQGMKVEWDGQFNAATGKFGKLTYLNNKTEVGDFDIKMPVEVTYAWGTIKLEITCHVAKTVK